MFYFRLFILVRNALTIYGSVQLPLTEKGEGSDLRINVKICDSIFFTL